MGKSSKSSKNQTGEEVEAVVSQTPVVVEKKKKSSKSVAEVDEAVVRSASTAAGEEDLSVAEQKSKKSKKSGKEEKKEKSSKKRSHSESLTEEEKSSPSSCPPEKASSEKKKKKSSHVVEEEVAAAEQSCLGSEKKKKKHSSKKDGGVDEAVVEKEVVPEQEEEEEENDDNEDEVGNVVFVNGLSFGTSEKQLREFFATAGEVKRIRWHMKDHGKAFIQFASSGGASKALEMNGRSGPGGRDVNVYEHRPSSWYNPSAISIEGSDPSLNDQLKDALSAHGKVKSIEIHGNNTLVVMGTPREADKVVAADIHVAGTELRVRLATARYCYGLEQSNGGQQGGGRGGGRGGTRGGRGGARGGRGGNGRGRYF